MVKPYNVTFTGLAKAAAEASDYLAAVEAKARAEIDEHVLWIGEPVCEKMDLPSGGFHAFAMPDGCEFIAWFCGDDGVEIDAVGRHESLGRVEDKAEWLGLTGEVILPVGATDGSMEGSPSIARPHKSSSKAFLGVSIALDPMGGVVTGHVIDPKRSDERRDDELVSAVDAAHAAVFSAIRASRNDRDGSCRGIAGDAEGR